MEILVALMLLNVLALAALGCGLSAPAACPECRGRGRALGRRRFRTVRRVRREWASRRGSA